jgi:glycine/D-amino acid oxidase-like deaminating enzyme
VIVGSGIAGLTTAYELSGQGQKVAVLDRGAIGFGMTARTSAHLSANNDDTFKTFIDKRGEKLAREFYVSQNAAIDRIETIQEAESIACDFRRVDAFLFPGPRTSDEEMREEHDATLMAGMKVVYADGVPLRGLERKRFLRYPNQAFFHPTNICAALHIALRRGAARSFATQRSSRWRRKTGASSLRLKMVRQDNHRYQAWRVAKLRELEQRLLNISSGGDEPCWPATMGDRSGSEHRPNFGIAAYNEYGKVSTVIVPFETLGVLRRPPS